MKKASKVAQNEDASSPNLPPEAVANSVGIGGAASRVQLASPKAVSWFGQFLKLLGPGLITGAADDDPSGIATYAQVGAQFGPSILWTMLFIYSGWQKITFADTQKPGYQRLLSNAGTIGALLGAPSNWLADLDCDTEPLLEFMLANNELRTLRTRGARAGGIWFRNLDQTLERVYPLNLGAGSPLAKGGKIDEKTGLVKIGELRCGHGQ